MTESLGQVLHGMTQVLESADGSEERELRVLELLRGLVPYEQCALFSALAGREPCLLVVPPASPEVRALLSETLVQLHGRLVDERSSSTEGVAKCRGSHLAVPLVGNDRVIGVLFVSGGTQAGPAGGFTEQHLRELSIVGALLASYLVMVDQARALDEARREAEASNRLKDEFLALVSRGLKAPLMSTLACSRMVRSLEMGESGRSRLAEEIERNVQSQVKLIDEILSLGCVAAAGLRLNLAPVEPASLIHAAIEELRLRAERRAIRLETTVDESIDQIVVDPGRMVQVIANILANAIQFTPKGGHVVVRLERAGAHARIQVIDRGSGIPADVLPRVFGGFQGGQNPITGTYRELGTGLAMVKPVVEAHGGSVRAESPGPGKGSTFTVELPLPGEAAAVLTH